MLRGYGSCPVGELVALVTLVLMELVRSIQI